MSAPLETVHPEAWPPPRGYSNGVITRGPLLHVAGQVGWNAEGRFVARDFVGQFAQCIDNVLAVARAAGCGPERVVRMTIFVTDLAGYRASLGALGSAWRERMGRSFPAMALVGVAGLVEPEALVEIEAVVALDEASNAQPDATEIGPA